MSGRLLDISDTTVRAMVLFPVPTNPSSQKICSSPEFAHRSILFKTLTRVPSRQASPLRTAEDGQASSTRGNLLRNSRSHCVFCCILQYQERCNDFEKPEAWTEAQNPRTISMDNLSLVSSFYSQSISFKSRALASAVSSVSKVKSEVVEQAGRIVWFVRVFADDFWLVSGGFLSFQGLNSGSRNHGLRPFKGRSSYGTKRG